jgi:hypothetical protein
MKDGKTESGTEIAEGLPPTPPMDENPVEPAEHDVRMSEPTAMQVFFAWEKLRILLNICATISMCVAPAFLFVRGDHFTGNFFAFLVAANLLACIGPVGENYFCWFGIRRSVSRAISLFFLAITFFIWIWILSLSQSV